MKISYEAHPEDKYLVIGAEPGYEIGSIVKISRKKDRGPVIIFHRSEKIAFAYISQREDRKDGREIVNIFYSSTKEYYEQLLKKIEILDVWAQEKERKEAVLDWLVTQMHKNKLHNLDWLSEMRRTPSEKYWIKVAEISGIKEEIKRHEQYTSLDNIFILYALEYSKKNSIPAPFEIEEIPLPQIKEIYVIDLKNPRVSFFIPASYMSSSSNLSTNP